MLTATASYQIISNNLTRSLQTTASKPDVARATKYYLAHIGDVKTIDDFLNNDHLFSYAMKAFGLEDMTYAKAFMRKVLTEGTDDPQSFGNKLTDKRYLAFAQAFNFKRYAAATTAFDITQQGTVDKYYRQTLEGDAGSQDQGVQLALYFQRMAPNVTSVYGLLADKALLKVTQTALGLPEASGALDINKQAALISKKLNIDDLKDPAKLDKLITRFTSLWQVQNETTAPANVLLVDTSTSFGISGNLLAGIQNLRTRGKLANAVRHLCRPLRPVGLLQAAGDDRA